MPAVRKILGMRTISETSALVFGHLPVILSMRVYLHIQPTFPYPVWNPTGPLRPGSVSRIFLLKNLKGRVSERTLRNTERYALSRYLPHSHFFPTLQIFTKKVRSSCFRLFHTHRLTCWARFQQPMWWERSRTPMRLRTMNVMRTIPNS